MEALQKRQRNELETYQKRIELLIGSRFRETDAVAEAIEIQDRLRKKIGHWHGAKAIAQWRQKLSKVA